MAFLGVLVAKLVVYDNESIERAIKRFKRKVEQAGIISQFRDRQQYDKPSIKKKLKSIAARKRSQKARRQSSRKDAMFD